MRTKEQALRELEGINPDNYFDYKPTRSNPLRGAWSKSVLHKAAHSPYEYEANIPMVVTAPMKFGTLVDLFITEPHTFEKDYVITEHEDARRKPYKDAKLEATEAGKILAKRSEVQRAESIFEAIQKDSDMKAMLSGDAQKVLTGVVELSGSAGKTHIAMKGKTDFWIDHGDGSVTIWDMKVTGAPNDNEIAKICRGLGYHWQHYIYQALAEQAGYRVRDFAFGFIRSDKPFRSRVVRCNEHVLHQAGVGVRKAFSMLYSMGAKGLSPADMETPAMVLGERPPERDYWDTLEDRDIEICDVNF